MWQPIETAPKDQFLLLCGPSEYTITPMVVTTGCMYSDYHAGRWIDHANDDLADWGFKPTHWAPLILPGAQPAPSDVRKVVLGFRWDSEAQCHIPTLEVEFEPVPAEFPNDAKGWQDRDRLAAWLEGIPAQPAQSVPDGWLQHAARMATLAKKLREPDWCLESIREMQRELRTLEEAALAAAPGEVT